MSATIIPLIAKPPVIERTPAGAAIWEPHEAVLRRFHEAGRTAQWVADYFGQGVTKNAIVGAWSRLQLPGRKRPATYTTRTATPEEIEARLEARRQQRNARQRVARDQKRAPAADATPQRRTQASILADIHAKPLDPSPAPASAGEPLVPILVHNEMGQLEANERLTNKTCRWYVGDPAHQGSGFCPETKVVGLPYCEAHARRAFAPPTVRRPRAAPSQKPERISTFADAESA